VAHSRARRRRGISAVFWRIETAPYPEKMEGGDRENQGAGGLVGSLDQGFQDGPTSPTAKAKNPKSHWVITKKSRRIELSRTGGH